MKMGQKFLEEIVKLSKRMLRIIKMYPDGDDIETKETVGLVIRGLILKILDYLKLLVLLEHERDLKQEEKNFSKKSLVASKIDSKNKENDEVEKKNRT